MEIDFVDEKSIEINFYELPLNRGKFNLILIFEIATQA